MEKIKIVKNKIQPVLSIIKMAAFFVILGLASLSLLILLPLRTPIKPYIVLSGSMNPTILEGSIVFVKRGFNDIKKGNIVTFKRPGKPQENVTHRIVGEDKSKGRTVYITKGDANTAPDLWVVPKESIWGKAIFSVPFLGYVISFAKTKLGVILLIALPLVIIALSEARIIYSEIKKMRKKSKEKKVVILLALITLFLPNKFAISSAVFSDTVFSTNQQISTGDWTPPESEVDSLSDYQNNSQFFINYTASDDSSGVKEVRLYYQHNFGGWQLFGTDTTIDYKFEFTSPAGDGLYEFFSIAIDNAGNIEDDWDGDGVLQDDELPLSTDTSTTVDTTPPLTMFSTSDLIAVANEQLYNGGFENGNLDGWTVDSNGSDHQVTTEDKKTGAYSALIGFKTAASSTEPAYDSITQTVSLSSAITSTLSFWYRLLTESNVSGGFFDAFVTPTGSDPITVAHNGWDDVLLSDEDLDWKNVIYQLNGLEGKDIEIEFKVTQPYEGYKTWGYLDDVKVCAATNSATTATEFSLFSHDGSGADNSTINYSIDGGPQRNYTLPFTLSEGVHNISYSSTDDAGNSETPKQATISATAAPVDFGVVLNEFLPNSSGDDSAAAPDGEWVKLYNNSTADIDVVGWELKNASNGSLTIEGETIVPAKGTLTVYRNGDSDFTINNQTETIKLYNGSDLVDSYAYNFATGLPEGKSLKRDPDGTGGWKDPEVEPKPFPEAIPQSEPSLPPEPSLEPLPEIATESAAEPTPEPSPEPSPLPDLPIQEPIIIEEILNETAE